MPGTKSLADTIHLGMHEHTSIGHFSKNGFGGGRIDLDIISSGPVDTETGMIVDLAKYKEWIRKVLKEEFEHRLIIESNMGKVVDKCRTKGMHLIETPHGAIEGLPLVMFDALRRAIHTPLELSSLRYSGEPKKTWKVWSNQGDVKIERMWKTKKRTSYECNLVFAHRIIGLGICENPHSHSWVPKMQFDRELSPDEYKLVTTEIEKKLRKSWAGKGVFHTGDTFGLSMGQSKHTKELASPPTTEIISIMMIREIEWVLRKTGIDVKLEHFELWETPTNFVTT